MRARLGLLVGLLSLGLLGCPGDPPEGVRKTVRNGGPLVRYDIEAKPLPEVPLPNDVATRLDPTSPTGRRLNVSLAVDTEVERRLRREANRLTGFGVYSPITVPFESAIDVADLHARHNANRDPSDDGILLFRLGEDGEACSDDRVKRRLVPLDVGGGNFPLALEKPCHYQYHLWLGDYRCEPPSCVGDDPRWNSSQIMFDTYDEDANGNGELDPYEDTDFDGVLDVPNTWSGEDPGLEDYGDVITFYERESNTLIVWPLRPLWEGTRYAVVLTKNIRGEDGKPVESPFDGVSAADQAEPLQQLEEFLPCHGLDMDDVAFAWTFTTGTPSRDLRSVREGLYESGSLAFLGQGTPPEDAAARLMREADDEGNFPDAPYTLPTEVFSPLIGPISGSLLDTPGAGARLTDDLPAIDYFVVGEFPSPWLLADKDGLATPMYPHDADEYWDVDPDAGTATWRADRVPYICAIPKATEEHKPPFPVVMYGHGYSAASFEILGFSGRFARAGFALCGVEAPGHGVVIPEDETAIITLVDMFLESLKLRNFAAAYLGGRARELDNDGAIGDIDNGGDFWVGDIFHTRDMVRQLITDQMQFIRILRATDGVRRWETDTNGDGEPDLLLDFNGDGVPDIGGWVDENGNGVRDAGEPDNAINAWGQSLGGISSALMAGLEPALRATAPISAAAGMSQVAIRSTNVGVPEATLLPMLGPYVTFAPHLDDEGNPDGRVDVGMLVANINRTARPVFHVSDKIRPGDRVIVRNVRKNTERRGFIPDDLRARVPIAADALHTMDKRGLLGMQDGDTEPVDLTRELALAAGDPLEIVILDGWDGPVRETISEVTVPFTFQGANHVEGTPIIALAEGLGHQRNSPDFRRLLGLAQLLLEPADPATYAPHVFERPFEYPYETEELRERRESGRATSLVIYHSVGDTDVPIATGIGLARAAGIIDLDTVRDEWGMTENDVLLTHRVIEGVERLGYHPQVKEPQKFGMCPPRPASEWRCPPARPDELERYRAFFDEEAGCPADHGDCPGGCPDGEACFYDDVCVPCKDSCAAMADFDIEYVHFDVNDVDDGTDRQTLPEYNLDPPLRTRVENEAGTYGLRIPYNDRGGSHGSLPPIPERGFDINGFTLDQIVWFMLTDGRELRDDPCLADGSCDFLPWND